MANIVSLKAWVVIEMIVEDSETHVEDYVDLNFTAAIEEIKASSKDTPESLASALMSTLGPLFDQYYRNVQSFSESSRLKEELTEELQSILEDLKEK